MRTIFTINFKSIFLVIALIFFYNQKGFSQHKPINVGDNITGTLQFQGDVNGYTFCSAADVPIYIKASSQDITFLRIELYDAMGNLIASDFSVIAPKILKLTTGSGEYTILVKSQNANEQGEYFLSLQRTVNPIGATPLICNSATMDSLIAVTELKPFTFSVASGTTINLTLSSSEITFVRMELYNPSGERIASDFSVIVAEIQTTLNEAGCYTLLVMSHNCNEMGSFTLAQNVTAGECSGVCATHEICDNQIDDDGDGLIDAQDEDCCNFFVSTNIDNVNLDNSIKIFPNPSKGEFVIKLDALGEKVKLQLFNIQGKKMEIDKKSNDQIIVNGIAKGIYFVSVSSNDFQITKRIIVQ